MKLRVLDADTEITFGLFDINNVVQVPQNRVVFFKQLQKEFLVFETHYLSVIEAIEIEINMHYGDLTVLQSFDNIDYRAPVDIRTSEKRVILAQKDKQRERKRAYFKVISNQLSSYSILV